MILQNVIESYGFLLKLYFMLLLIQIVPVYSYVIREVGTLASIMYDAQFPEGI